MIAPIHNMYLCGCHGELECPDLADTRMAATLRRCWLQPSRPIGVSEDEERAAIDAGLMRFVEGTYVGRYSITAAGHEFLSER